MKYLALFLINLLIIPASIAAVSNIYDFDVDAISASVSLLANDSDNDFLNDSILATVMLNESGSFLLSFDILKNDSFIGHIEKNIAEEFSGNLGRISSGNYELIVTISDEVILFQKKYVFDAVNFENINGVQALTEPENMQAEYELIDDNNNSLYDYLIVQPEGSIRVYDSFDDLIIASESNKIDLKKFYLKKAEGPYRIIIEKDGEIYETATTDISYTHLEKPVLPDLSVQIIEDRIIVKNRHADAFDIQIIVYEDETLIFSEKIEYLKSDGEYLIYHPATTSTRSIVDSNNEIEESDEENNYAHYAGSGSEPGYESEFGGNTQGQDSMSLKISGAEFQENSIPKNESISEMLDDGNSKASADDFGDLSEEKSNLLAGNAISETGEKPNKLMGYSIMLAATLVGLYFYRTVFPRD